MNKIYDKLLLVISALVLAGGVFLYLQTSGGSTDANPSVDAQPANNPYNPEPIPESEGEDGNWPEVSEQSTGWRYDVFTPPKIFIDEQGQFSAEGWVPPPPPVPFGVYLAEIRRNPYRIQFEGYIEEDASDVSKTLLLFYDEEKQSQVRARPGETEPEHEFEVRDFTIERIRTDDGGIDKVAEAIIYDQRRGEEVELIHGERLFDSGVTVVIRSNEDPSVEIALTEAPSEFETPSGNFTLKEINLEESSVTVEKHGNEEVEAETKTLVAESSDSTPTTEASSPQPSPQGDDDDTPNAFDALF